MAVSRTGRKNMPLLAALVLALNAGSAQADTLRAGIMVASSGRYIVAMGGPALLAGETVTLVTVDVPQQVRRVVIVRRLSVSDVMAHHDTPGPYYEVAPEHGSNALPDFAVAVLGRPIIERVGTAVRLRVANQPSGVRARGCTSSEGLHLTLWAGEPLKGRRLWHTYYYLGYDVESTCQPADYQQGG
jgi:hypothetical protein